MADLGCDGEVSWHYKILQEWATSFFEEGGVERWQISFTTVGAHTGLVSVRGEKVQSCLQRLSSHLGVRGQLGVRRRERLFSEVSFLSSKTSCHKVVLAIGYWY